MRRYMLSVVLVLSICLLSLLLTTSAQPSSGECSAPPSNPASVHRAELSIDAVTVLLPVHVHSGETIYHVKYPIQARGACFSWRTDKPHLIRLEPIAETRCSETVSVKNAQTGQFETVTKEGYTGIYVSAVTHVPNASDKPVGYPFTSNRHFQRRLSAWISAHDITRETERFEQCEIFIDQIARLEILTSTRRINVGDIEALDLAAYDSMDNVFSSLDGLPFRWDNSAPANLKQLSLFESGLEVEDELNRLERTGVATRIMPVKGSLPGKVNMTATLVDDTHHISTTVPFLVIEPLYLEPNQRRLAPGSELQMKLKTRFSEDKIKHTSNVIHETEGGEDEESATGTTSPPGGMSVPASASAAADTQIIQRREITMPSTQYKWSSLDKSIVAINEHSGMLVARTPGHTNVVVKDVNAPAHYKEAEITVVEPVKILLDLRPYNPNGNMNNALALRNWKKPRVSCAATGIAATGDSTPSWFIQEGALYELFISLKDASDKFISITPNVVFELTVKGKSISRSNQAQRVHIASDASGKATSSLIVSLSSAIPLVASSLGSSTITVSLTSIKSVENNMEYVLKPGPLRSTATIHVTPSVSLLGSSPWKLPLVTPSTPKYQLRADGGSGKYAWESTNAHGLRVEQSGIDAALSNATASAFVVPLQAGLIPVKVTDACNPENSILLDVNVASPRSLEFIKLDKTRYESSTDASDSAHHTIDVYVRVRGSSETGHQSFHDCSKLFLLASFQQGNKAFQSFAPPSTGSGSSKSTPANVFQCLTECPVEAGSNCFHLQLRSTQVEMSSLSLNLIDSNSAQGIPLHGVSGISHQFSAFSPLYYQYAPLLLGVGEGVMVQMQGGPLAWPQRSLFNGIQPATVTYATYAHLTEVLFSQTYFSSSASDASSGALFDRSELESASFLKSDISSKEILSIAQVPGSSPDRFFVTCNKASEDAIALHIVSSNSRDLGNQGFNPLPNPLAAHRSIRVQCYPRLKLAAEPSRLAIGESKTVSIEQPHPLSKFVRYALREGDAGEVFTVDAVTGVVKGIRLGQRLVVASVDRTALLKSLGFPETTLQPFYGPGDALSDSKRLSVEFDDFRLRFASPYYAPNILLKSHTSIADVIGENNESLLDPSYDKVQCLWRIDSSIGGIGITPALSSPNHASHISSWNTYHPPVHAHAGDHSFDSLVHSQVYGCSIRVIGLKIGTFTLSVAINVTLPHQSTRTSYFEHSIDITVVEPLRLYSNEQLLLAPGSTSQILTNIQNTHLVYMNASLKYTVSSYEGTSNKNGPYVTVDEKGLITVRQRKEGDDHRDIADAVILIQSSHALLANSTSTEGADSQPVVQSLVVLVSMRPIAQLFVASSDLPSSLLCPSRSYNFTLGVASSIGKRFHVFPADEDLPSVVSNLHDSSVTPISVDILTAVLPSSNVEHALRAYTLLIGEADASHNVVLQHRLIEFDIESQPIVTPLTLPVYIAPSSARCVEPNAILLKLKLSYTRKVWDDQYKINSVRRDEFVARFVSEIGDALHFTRETAAARIKIFNIDISSNVVELLLLPLSFAGSYHRDQWFYHYFTVAPSNQLEGHAAAAGSPHALIANEEAWSQTPLSLAQALQKQVLDRSHSALVWSGELTSAIDAAAPFTRNEISPLEAQHMVRERSGTSSPLSTPVSTSSSSSVTDGSASSSSDSVWADERSVATLERVLADGVADMHHDSVTAAEASGAGSASASHDGSSSSSSSSPSLSLSGAVEQFEKERKRTMEDFRELLKSYQAEQVRINTPLEFQQAQLQQQYYRHTAGTGLLAPADSLLALIISLLLNPIVLAVIFVVLGVLYFIWETGFKPSEQEKLLRENLPAAVQADILARARFTSWLWRGILNVFCCRSSSARVRGAVGVAGSGAGGIGGAGSGSGGALGSNVLQQRSSGLGFVGPNQYQQQRELHTQPAAVRLNLTPRSNGSAADIYRQY